MNGYLRKSTQEEKILSLLQERGRNGVFAWEITDKLNILQYNARIFGLRKKGYNIINKEPCHFVLKEETMDSREEIEAKLELLREKYRKTPDPVMRGIIAAQGKCLKIVLEQKINSQNSFKNSPNQTYEEAKEVFGS